MANPINIKSFNISVVTSRSFNIFIEGFKFATTILFRIRDKVSITFVPSLRGKLFTTINLKRVRLLISQVKLIVKPTQIINARKVSFVYVFSQRMKAITTIYVRVPIVMISKARQKIVTTLSLKRVQLLLSPTLATFFTLGQHDPSTLGTFDTQTLGNMDYIVT